MEAQAGIAAPVACRAGCGDEAAAAAALQSSACLPDPPAASLVHSASTASTTSMFDDFDDSSSLSSASSSESDDDGGASLGRNTKGGAGCGGRRATTVGTTRASGAAALPPLPPSGGRRHGRSCSGGARRSSVASVASERESEGGAPPADHGCVAAAATIVRSAHEARTPDGWRLHLHRVVAATARGAAATRRYPVVLCPGLASGGVESYDFEDHVSLAKHLAERGFDVWVPDLRGNGRSDRPSWWDRNTWWTVDEHLTLDLPTVVDAIKAETGASQVHWVGHSMGGMLAVGAVSRGMECAASLRSLTLLASGCFGAGSWHSLVAPFLLFVTRAGFYANLFVPLFASWKGPCGWLTRTLFCDTANTDPALAHRLMKRVLSFIPSGVVQQFIGSMNSPLGISSSDGSFNYADPKALAHDCRPVFGIVGDRDLFCPAAGGLKTVNLFGGPHRRFLFLGPQYGTTQHHYAHFCPLVGRNVKTEVFPHIESFLSEFDAPRSKWPAPSSGGAAASSPGGPAAAPAPPAPALVAPHAVA